jgi:hypothetical protein
LNLTFARELAPWWVANVKSAPLGRAKIAPVG